MFTIKTLCQGVLRIFYENYYLKYKKTICLRILIKENYVYMKNVFKMEQTMNLLNCNKYVYLKILINEQ